MREHAADDRPVHAHGDRLAFAERVVDLAGEAFPCAPFVLGERVLGVYYLS